MSVTINVNNISMVHKGSSGVAIASAPDVCKTPSPGGPIPIPYPNIARSSDLAKGSKSVKADGNSIALKDSKFSTSTGDEPGTAGGGIISSKTKGAAKFINYSFNVKVESRNVARLTDPMTMNGNADNTGAIAEGQRGIPPPGLTPEEFEVLCQAFCHCNSKDPQNPLDGSTIKFKVK